ncbi:hypothetical protein IGI04_023574 [Brassica rapa subsp. trilocularis]|uniref:Uncharacterized protein n=1 Tax=Brassica rapa subsp. trilocularis TaxID=1813537 RepID=A0ABQ7M6R1_BRACM|nr:hypothetical protein IGI04_023574 [Brassica rapa subsp. trilocularis]
MHSEYRPARIRSKSPFASTNSALRAESVASSASVDGGVSPTSIVPSSTPAKAKFLAWTTAKESRESAILAKRPTQLRGLSHLRLFRLKQRACSLPDAPQYMQPGQDGVQDDHIITTEVQADDRAVYRIDPRAAKKELRLMRHSLSLLVRLIRAECPDEQTDGSAGQYDQFLNFNDQNFSKARILQLSKDLGCAGTRMMHEPYPADCPERAPSVLLRTAKEPIGSDEPGR